MSVPEFAGAANPPPAAAAKSKRKAVPNRVTTVKRPMKPMAGFVPRVEASIHYGCADAQEVQAAASRIGVPPGEMESLFSGLLPLSATPERTCINYAVAMLPAGLSSTLAVLEAKSGRDGRWATIVQSRPNGTIDSTRETLPTDG